MNYFMCLFILLVLTNGHAYAFDTLLLKKINVIEFDKLRVEVKNNIANDINMSFVVHFNENQSFAMILNDVPTLKLIPVKFNSKDAKNDVCILSVFSDNNKLIETLPLHYQKGDGDEIVESCIGVQAVASERRNNKHLLIYLLRSRAGNNYGDTAFIASYDSGKLTKNEALTDCVSNNKDISSMIKVRKAIKQCS